MNILKIIVGAVVTLSAPFYAHWMDAKLDYSGDYEMIGCAESILISFFGVFFIVWGVADIINKKP